MDKVKRLKISLGRSSRDKQYQIYNLLRRNKILLRNLKKDKKLKIDTWLDRLKISLEDLDRNEWWEFYNWLHWKVYSEEPRNKDAELKDRRRAWKKEQRIRNKALKEVKPWQAEFLEELWSDYVQRLLHKELARPEFMWWRIWEYPAFAIAGQPNEIWFNPKEIKNDEQFLYYFYHEVAHLKVGPGVKSHYHGGKFKSALVAVLDAMAGDLRKAAKWESYPDVKSYLREEAKRREKAK